MLKVNEETIKFYSYKVKKNENNNFVIFGNMEEFKLHQ